VLINFLLISAFFLDGLASAAEQLCGRAYGARERVGFSSATRLTIAWGFAFAIGVSHIYALFGART
jgi:MATE family multidrug resistance protein